MTTATATKTRKTPAPRKAAVKAAKATTAVKATTTTPTAGKSGTVAVKAARPRMPKPVADVVLWDDATDLTTTVADTIRHFGSIAQHSPRTNAGKAAKVIAEAFNDDKADVFWGQDSNGVWHVVAHAGSNFHIVTVNGAHSIVTSRQYKAHKFTEFA